MSRKRCRWSEPCSRKDTKWFIVVDHWITEYLGLEETFKVLLVHPPNNEQLQLETRVPQAQPGPGQFQWWSILSLSGQPVPHHPHSKTPIPFIQCTTLSILDLFYILYLDLPLASVSNLCGSLHPSASKQPHSPFCRWVFPKSCPLEPSLAGRLWL